MMRSSGELFRGVNGYIPTLDGWRAVAILGVIFYHLGPAATNGYPFLAKIQSLGQNGVELFFAISGVLICSRLLDEERERGQISLRGFYLRRLFRIQPAALAFLIAIALLSFAHIISIDPLGWFTALFSVRNLYRPMGAENLATGVYTSHFWSLAIEEHFYLVMPWLLVWWQGRRRLYFFVLITIVTIFAYEYTLGPRLADRAIRSELELCWLFLPASIALLIRHDNIKKWTTKLLPTGPVVTLVAALGLGFAYGMRHTALLWLPSLSILILSTILRPTSLVSRFLELAPMRAIGRISYSLYLWQQLFCIDVPHRVEEPLRWMQGIPQCLFFASLCAILSYFLIEKPLVRLGHKLAPPVTAGHADEVDRTEPRPEQREGRSDEFAHVPVNEHESR